MRLLFCCALAIGISGCGIEPPRMINDPYSHSEATEADRDRILQDFFECDECESGQLRRVQELGDKATPKLIEARNGLVPDQTADLIARCNRINGKLTARGLVPAESCAQYSARFQDRLRRRYRARAVEGLLAIRTPSACAALEDRACFTWPPFPPLNIKLSTDRSLQNMGVDTPIEP